MPANTSDSDTEVCVTVYFADREPAGPYRITLSTRRTKHLRLNERSDHAPIPLDTNFSSLIEFSIHRLPQTRADSRQGENALFSTAFYPA